VDFPAQLPREVSARNRTESGTRCDSIAAAAMSLMFFSIVIHPGRLDEVVSNLAGRERVGACVGKSRDFSACHGGYAIDRERFWD
jgi:hypothetical protein